MFMLNFNLCLFTQPFVFPDVESNLFYIYLNIPGICLFNSDIIFIISRRLTILEVSDMLVFSFQVSNHQILCNCLGNIVMKNLMRNQIKGLIMMRNQVKD